eukprot:m.343319 g.343319  ORF g.343319 m.343319 type:complete len:366 (+) comp22687_c0_seq1:102-1199(+)
MLAISITIWLSSIAFRATNDPLPETDWMVKARVGVFTHYLDGLQNNFGRSSLMKNTSWEECVKEFDAENYAESAAATGASYAVITVMQGSRFMIAPNTVYDKFTGYNPGDACSTRDLVLDIHAALSKRGLKLMLYYTCDGPHLDPQARSGLAWPDSPQNSNVSMEFVKRWTQVLQEYSVRYGDRVSGWWIDGCYHAVYNYTEPTLKPYKDAVRAGNPNAVLCLNNGVHHPNGQYPDRVSVSQDYTCGESDDFTEVPKSRFVSGPQTDPSLPNVTAQWHTLGFLGSQWASPGTCQCKGMQSSCNSSSCTALDQTTLTQYSKDVVGHEGVLTVDLQLFRNGSMNADQVNFLKQVWHPILEESHRHTG